MFCTQKTWRTAAGCVSTEDREGKNGYASLTSWGSIAKSLSLDLSRWCSLRCTGPVNMPTFLAMNSHFLILAVVYLLAGGISSHWQNWSFFFITSRNAILHVYAKWDGFLCLWRKLDYIVSNHMNLPNFTAATYFVYTLQVNSSCSTSDPVIQFLNGDIGKCSPRFHRAVTAVNDTYVTNLIHHRICWKKISCT